MVLLKNILVATDFNEPSETALTYGRELARTFGGRLHVLHVVETVMASNVPPEYYPLPIPGLQEQVEDAARQRLDALVTLEDREKLQALPVLRTSSRTAAAIIQYAKDAKVDLILIGTHGRGAASRLLMGSVAERVVRSAPCPVLAVRRPEHEFVVPETFVAVANT